MIKIVEIKGGLQGLQKKPGLQEQLKSYPDFQGITRAQREGYIQFREALGEEISSESNRILAEERIREAVRTLQQLQSMPLILGTGGGDEYVAGVDPYIDMTPLTPHSAYIQSQVNPTTGNTEVLQSDGNSITFSRDMTEEQMIAYFDSLN